ncbi:sulfur oxidation c-type cytochrome SoxX [Limibaculum sp. M0105]|uniref:Sulfur oxidation c-type cytochrome SoxX n=1 Tax=Thermohalobaculum xanthum TaxID=2753746 RepID=A0A8J7SBG7_9RHOB|nr:sulfur oxidation c-type cytochrome SoxX [Thermohalobaculum xanthum]MBK0398338.1 sulfur oxidation c-type cytochrome SoxX [Thermohalobaculum xanthum]
MIRATLGLVVGCALAGAAVAETAPADVKFGEYGEVAASLTGSAGDPASGRKVFSERSAGNCVACHTVSEMVEDVQFHGDVGPSLDGVADRWNEAELRGIVSNAKNVFDGTVMPAFYKTTGYIRPGDAFTTKPATEPLPPLLTAQQIEDLVAYLMTLKE